MNTLILRRWPRQAAHLLLAALCMTLSSLRAADESCSTCGGAVTVSGDFAHHTAETTPAVSGTGFKPETYREEVHGTTFTVTIANLPAGRYTVEIGAVETFFKAPGETVFDVRAGDVVLAKDFDLIATAGGPHLLATIRGIVEKPDDALRGPMRLTFSASKGHAKFHTITIRDQSGASVLAFAANELADVYSAQASQVPEIKEPAIWRDPNKPLRARAEDLIRRMSLAEKVAQLKNAAPAIERLDSRPTTTGTKPRTASPTTITPPSSRRASAPPRPGTRRSSARRAGSSASRAARSSTTMPTATTATPSGGPASPTGRPP